MSKVIPKEQLTAYQRWELATFDEEGAAGHPLRGQRPSGPEPIQQVALPTAEQLEHLHQEAWREGYELGLEEGRKAGFQAGFQAGEEKVRLLGALADAIHAGRLQQDDEVAREVLTLALTVARQVVRRAISVRPELILDAIKEALLSLPALNGHHKVVTHPDHVQLVQDWLAQEHGHLSWKVIPDARVEAGSFRFESAYSELDGSLRTRWREITECLGLDDDSWLS